MMLGHFKHLANTGTSKIHVPGPAVYDDQIKTTLPKAGNYSLKEKLDSKRKFSKIPGPG